MSEKSIVLIDGEHYPQVVARSIKQMRQDGEEPLIALMVGGTEKLGQHDIDLGLPVEDASKDPEASLAAAIDRHGVRRVLDLSDEPVLGYVERSRLASVSLWKGATYAGPGFSFDPPDRPRIVEAPSIGVIGSGKRTGKTAVAGYAANLFQNNGLEPAVLAMGRGGPEEPEVIGRGAELDSRALLEMAEAGRHAASDYLEDALIARVPTVGAWRAGGGLSGATGFSNYAAAVEKLNELKPQLALLEGSGASIPPASWDAGVMIVNAGIDPGHICGYFGYYRLLLSDLVVLTMVEESTDREQLASVERCIRRGTLKKPRAIRTVFRPYPLEDVAGRKVFYATTAPEKAGPILKEHLEKVHGAEIVAISHSLSDRKRLRQDMKAVNSADLVAVELKAAAVDVVTKLASDGELDVVYVENRPIPVGEADLDGALLDLAKLAVERRAAN